MTTYSTGNPVGSSDPRDLYDNAENLDNLVNGDQAAYNDRLGKSRRSWQSVEDQANQQEVEFNSDQSRRENEFQAAQDDREGVFNQYLISAGYQFAGDYAAGIEITQYNQVVRDTSGEFWRVSGSTELPYTTTGAGLPEGGNFVAVGDAALRQELALPVAGSGSDMVAYLPPGGGQSRSVTERLREHISVKDFGAVGDGVADDTTAIQSALDAAASGPSGSTYTLVFPSGKYKITAPLIMPSVGFGNIRISGYGARVYASDFSDFMLRAETTNYNGNNLTIEGLILDGGYEASGIQIDFVQEWLLRTVKIWNCRVGISLLNTYYGEVSGETIVRNCLTGIALGDSISGEVNTIGMSNIKINFAVAKTNFEPMLAGETTEEYNARVPSIGVEIKSIVLGTAFKGLTLEGMDYGFFGIRYAQGVNGYNHLKIGIVECYFEAIKVSTIHIVQHPGYSFLSELSLDILSCWFALGSPLINVQVGRFSILRNHGTVGVNIIDAPGYRCYIDTDLEPRRITGAKDSDTVFIRTRPKIINANALKYNAYSSSSVYPSPGNMLQTTEDGDGRTSLTPLSTDKAYINSVYGVTAKPLTFYSRFGNYEMLSGPVIRGEDENYYMLSTSDGTSISMRQVLNLQRLAPKPDSYTALELYRSTSLPEGVYECVDFPVQSGITKNAAGDLTYDGNVVIGTGEDAASQTHGASYGTPQFWNVQINRGYNWRASYWAWGPDWYGERFTTRAVGTLAERPAAPSFDYFIYYATDTALYYFWDGSVWSEHTPIF